jgi:holo-[acyl-carrier protein] synthase
MRRGLQGLDDAMIYGIGTDIVKIRRIDDAILKGGDRFIDRIFTKDEQEAASRRGDQARFYALRWAAKEAGWKALSPGYQNGVGWLDLEVTSNDDGKPMMVFHGKAVAFFEAETQGRGKIELSLSDDGGMALAFVVLSTP